MWDPPEADADDILGNLASDAMTVIGPLAPVPFAAAWGAGVGGGGVGGGRFAPAAIGATASREQGATR
jgi:hypothetical protein